jgi:phenylalanyl-tRNA synthetase beta chain
MRVSFKWIKELLDLPQDMGPKEVADRLTLVGLEVERVEDQAAALKGVVVGEILTREKHPNADSLSVCTVNVGEAAPLSIVCGAPNCDAGKLVPVATVGTTLPGGLAIAPRELRGVKSQGMLCSSKELGLPGGDHAGLLILDGGPTPGTPLSRVLGTDDAILEVSVTPNRPDALSHVGIARDLAAALAVSHSVTPPPREASGPHPTPHALTAVPENEAASRKAAGNPPRVKPPVATCAERGGPVDDAAQVRVEDLVRCPRYTARVIEGVSVGPSPAWLVRRLEACGMRSINNVVDATNLVLLERGHPLHAFDLEKLGLERGRPTVVVRTAKPHEKLTTLDGVERVLHAEDLVICDPDRPIALAGVMGGQATEVNQNTTKVLLESAYFQPSGIRRTARRHGLHTEASHRFERGTDPNRTLEDALHRCAQLITELAGGQVRRGMVQSYPKPMEPLEITLRPARAAALLGLPLKTVDEALVARALTALGLEVAGREAGALRFRVPTYRPDITLEVDLVEEVGRLLGLDRIPEVLPKGSGRLQAMALQEPLPLAQERTRGVLTGLGFDECVNLAFVSPKDLAPFDDQGQRVARLVLRNPLGEEQSVMRNTLLPSLLRNLGLNQRHGESDIRLFEVGTVFLGTRAAGAQPRPQSDDGPAGGDAYAAEKCHLGLVMVGRRAPWAHDVPHAEVDFYDLKGVVEDLLGSMRLSSDLWDGQVTLVPAAAGEAPYLHPGASAAVKLPGATLGWVGVLHPRLQQALDLKGPVLVAELDLTLLSQRMPAGPRFEALPRFPAIRRDLAALVDENTSVEQVFTVVRGTEGAKSGLLKDVSLFDLFKGDKLPPGKKSVGITLTFRAEDKTLTDEVVNGLHQQVMSAVEKDLRAEVRKG